MVKTAMNKVFVPPIKSQGIKTQLVPWIKSIIPETFTGTWIEPFMGTGVVGFNIAPVKAILCDTNPHLINFYKAIQNDEISPKIAKSFLIEEGEKLKSVGEDHFYFIRERFNKSKSPLDFLFLNRSCFNGMIRFNKKGGFNVPFCRKPDRFAQAYVTKIVNQISHIYLLLKTHDFTFICQDFKKTFAMAKSSDILYCDPPYIGRHTDYFNGWDDTHENELFDSLSNRNIPFILSTWHHNDFRENEYIKSLWYHYHILTKVHFYHVGGSETNRNPMVEALITNFETNIKVFKEIKPEQLNLFKNSISPKASNF